MVDWTRSSIPLRNTASSTALSADPKLRSGVATERSITAGGGRGRARGDAAISGNRGMTADYAAILRRDLMSFVGRSFYELNPQTKLFGAPHLELMAAKLEACRRGEINRLIINLPPRNLKSHCASVAFPAWYLAHQPAGHVICASYGQDLADKFARDCRRIMASAWYRQLFPTRLADRQAVHDFATSEQGTRMATSVGGVLTGRGADIIIIDDPLKPDEALSESRRKAVNEWYDHTLLSRLNDKQRGCIVIIMQRLHQDDLV